MLYKEGGGIKRLRDGTEHHSWVQNGNSVTVKLYNNSATVELEIINPKLMKGTYKNAVWGFPVEYRRK